MVDLDVKKVEEEAAASVPLLLRACRLCLDECEEIKINIFEEGLEQQGSKKEPLVQQLFELFQIKYENYSTLPSSICQRCLYMVESFSSFRESIKTCETELQRRLRAFKLPAMEMSDAESQRPGLNGNPGVFEPEENCVITEVDPNQEYESSEDDFSMESDSETEEQAPIATTILPVAAVPTQQQRYYEHKNTSVGNSLIALGNTAEVSHPETPSVASNELLSIPHAPPGGINDALGLEFTTKNTFLCQYCDMAFTTQNDCLEHEARHDAAAPYICNFCPLRVASRPNLIYHIKEEHDAERPYVCTLCNKGFCRRSDLKKHTIVHTGVRPYTCSICAKSFSRNTNLTKHMRIHSSVKPHVCQRCPRSFSTAGELLRHARSHTEIKPFQCSRCPASFTRKDKLQLHEQAHYRRESEFLINQAKTVAANAAIGGSVNISAPSAGHMENMVVPLNPFGESEASSFAHGNDGHYRSNNSILAAQLQQRPPSGPKSAAPLKQSHPRFFNCNICTKSFTRERDLQRHQALHLDTLFTCKHCGTGFSRREKLIRHEQDQHAPQYPCDTCHMTFNKRESLETHMKVHELQLKMQELQQQTAALSSHAASSTGSVVPAVSAAATHPKDKQRPSIADMSFYSQMVPTMNLGFYSETRPEDRNGI